jgi:hypothetical protein
VFRADNAAGFGLCTCGSCSICTYTHRDPGLYTAYIYAYILYGVYTPYVYLTSLIGSTACGVTSSPYCPSLETLNRQQ